MPSTRQKVAPALLLLPMKAPSRAKTRLRASLHTDIPHERVVHALFCDTLSAALSCPDVANVLVLTTDRRISQEARALGAQVWTEEDPRAELNHTLQSAASTAYQQGLRIGVLPGDLPALRPHELGQALAAAGTQRAFCADRHSTGTTLLLAGEAPLAPQFGPGSAQAHRQSGAKQLLGEWKSLRTDVDTATDLLAAATLGLGQRTTALLRSSLPPAAQVPDGGTGVSAVRR
ncbi:2-phospho-L-lactate guanylyltransferase [Nocardia sp. NPDC005745]|uniref:2-phospho-L-lactate guanylyltransferase n=1 Tax=Nocardia sp. NPDC005745 TaxID=3157061 RepID=UPI0033DDA672